MRFSINTAVKSALINCEPWSLLKISGFPYFSIANFKQFTSKGILSLCPDSWVHYIALHSAPRPYALYLEHVHQAFNRTATDQTIADLRVIGDLRVQITEWYHTCYRMVSYMIVLKGFIGEEGGR